MYQIIVDNHDGNTYILHDSRSKDVRVHDAVCSMEINKTGTLTFSIAPTHKHFDKIHKLISEIYLFQDDDCIFCGRVLNDETDIYNFKSITCEGMLAYLLDSIQRANIYPLTGSAKITKYLTEILNIHNSQVDDYKHFSVGEISEVDSSDNLDAVSEYKDTLSTINNNLVNKYNHTYLSATFKNGKKVINYVNSSKLPKNRQKIIFGKNLLSINRTLKGEEIATCIIPLGAKVDTLDDIVDVKLNIEGLPDGLVKGDIYKKGDYIYDDSAVKLYGKIFKTIDFNSIEDDVDLLLEKGIEQLKYYSKLASTIELTAFDLHLLDVNVDSFRVGQKVEVYSKSHDLINKELIVQKISIDLDNPSNTTISLADEERISIDTNTSSSKKSNEAKDKLNDLEDKWNNNDYVDKGYFGTDDYNKDYSNKFKDNLNDYLGTDDFNNAMNDYFDSKTGSGGLTDLSRYALITDVQNAFDSLADLLKGV